MSDVAKHQYRRQRSIYEVHYNLKRPDEERAKPCPWRASKMEVQAYGAQVAGHQKLEGAKYLGLLQSNSGTILKPILKESQKREIDFYERLSRTDNDELLILKSFVPKYKGCKKFTFNGYENQYIILEDITDNMAEPCIMDVKIGRRTWDPLATPDKIKLEKSKYVQCREEYAFCIPGYQVHKISSGKLLKYGKEYGKKLHGNAVKDAISNYLNVSPEGPCRALLVQLLSQLWRIQRWAEKQTAVKLYAASILLVYDAARLRKCCAEVPAFEAKCAKPEPKTRRRSIHSMHSSGSTGPFSGQLTSSGPVYRKLNSVPLTPMALAQKSFTSDFPTSVTPGTDDLQHIIQNHSHKNDYDETVCKMKVNYKAALGRLSGERPHDLGAAVKVIDFAHAFFSDHGDEHGHQHGHQHDHEHGHQHGHQHDASTDHNFREGITNLVTVIEQLLREPVL